jgi:hypothetical protein
MVVKDIYEAVTVIVPCSQPVFLAHLDTTARSLMTKYGINRVINDGTYAKPVNINGDIAVLDEFRNAVVSNILFLLTGNEAHKSDYIYEADSAYKTVWRRHMKGVRMVGEDYYNV